jgi:hypothetical protein
MKMRALFLSMPVCLTLATPAVADLTGTTVTTDRFTPSSAVITAAGIEFSDGLFPADFTGNSLDFRFAVDCGGERPCESISLGSFTISFTDAAFLGANISKVSDTFPLTDWDLTGNVLTLSVPSLGVGQTITLDAVFSINAVPGPIVGAGLPGVIAACGGLIAWARRRRKARAEA